MPAIGVTGPDGVIYDVPAENAEEAAKKFGEWWKLKLEDPEFKKSAQIRMNKSAVAQAEAAPEWAKPFMAADDVARVGVDAATFGLADKGIGYFTGQDEGMRTQASRARMGAAAIPAEVAGAVAMPSTVPSLVRAAGGGPAARTLTGTLGGAVEGGVVGGVDAATHGEPVVPGVLSSMGMGATGQALGSAVNRIGKWWKGPGSEAPSYTQTKLPEKPTARDYANVAATETELAAKKGADLPGAARREFADLTVGPPARAFNKEQKAILDRIIKGDPATNALSGLGHTFGNPLIGLGSMAGVGYGHDPVTGAAIGAGLLGGPRIAKAIARGGTREAISDLRRSVYGKPKREEFLSEEDKAMMAKALRQLEISTGGY